MPQSDELLSSLIQLLRPLMPLQNANQELSMDSDLQALGVDSLALVELIFLVETSYDVTFAEEHLVPETFTTVGSLYGVVNELCAKVG